MSSPRPPALTALLDREVMVTTTDDTITGTLADVLTNDMNDRTSWVLVLLVRDRLWKWVPWHAVRVLTFVPDGQPG